MNKILTSRTVWTIVAMFVVGGLTSIVSVLPPAIGFPLQGLLGAFAIYFKVNPSQQY